MCFCFGRGEKGSWAYSSTVAILPTAPLTSNFYVGGLTTVFFALLAQTARNKLVLVVQNEKGAVLGMHTC